MVSTRRGSDGAPSPGGDGSRGGKRPAPSSSSSLRASPTKRAKAEAEKKEDEVKAEAEKEEEVKAEKEKEKEEGAAASVPEAEAPPAAAERSAAVGDASVSPAGTSSGPTEAEMKGVKRPWARLISQCSKTPHFPIFGNKISVGRDENSDIRLDDQTVSRELCILGHLEQGGPCELHVRGKDGDVAVNKRKIREGSKVPFIGGDEVVFGQCGKHAYIFQHLLRDSEVTLAEPISASALLETPVANSKSIHLENRTVDNSVDDGPIILTSEPTHLGGSVPPVSSRENNQRVIEFALENKSDCIRSNPSASLPLTGWQTFKDELKQEILSPKDIEVTFDNFPYYLSESTKEILLSSAFVHMEEKFRKFLPKISSLDQRILLSGPPGSEIYQETLIKALAKHFDARLLILDSLTLCGMSSKFRESIKDASRDGAPSSSEDDIVGTSNRQTFKEGDRAEDTGIHSSKLTLRGSSDGSRGKGVLASGKIQSSKEGVGFNNPITDACELRPDSSGAEGVDSIALGKLIEVISEESKSSNLIVLVKDVEKSFTERRESHASLRSQLPPGVLIIGSHIQSENSKDQSHPEEFDVLGLPSGNQKVLNVLNIIQETLGGKSHVISKCATKSMKHLNNLFPNKICIKLPQNEAQLTDFKKQLDCDTETLRTEANILNINKFLTSRGIECNNLQELIIKDQLLTNESVDKIVGSAISHHLQHLQPPNDGKIVLPIESIKHGFNTLHMARNGIKSSKNALMDVATENVFEQNILSNVISPDDIGVTFEDIGALDNLKDTLRELIMLPLQRSELYSKGQLRKPVKGILLFGPPGTGKTILAKAVATEAGANFINVPMSSIASKWLGEPEKNVKAIFSLASKLSPAVIFVDEVDSFLGKRERPGEHETMRRMKNEFMINWDGLRTKEQERVIVLGATNRPFDLDDAAIRRFPRRLMVSLPDPSHSEKILKVLLSKETLGPDVDLESVANMTKGYSGSDLKNLCVTVAHCPIREILEKETKERSLAITEGRPVPPLYGGEDIRPLGMNDFKFALGQVCASCSPDSVTMGQLQEWNEKFGDGGSREKTTLGYLW